VGSNGPRVRFTTDAPRFACIETGAVMITRDADRTIAQATPGQSSEVLDYEDAPLTAFHIRVALGCTGSYFSDGFALGIIGLAIAAATPHLHLTPAWDGLLGGGSLAGLFFGALITGPAADRFGRRTIFLLTMALLAATSLAQGFVSSAAQLLTLRLILGFLLGADYVVSQSMLTEFSLRRLRGRMLGSLQTAWVFGFVCAYFVGYSLIDSGPDSWRWMLMCGAVPALLILPLRITIPESPLWLIGRGRRSEAVQIVRENIGANVDLAPKGVPVPAQGTRWTQLFSRTWRRRTIIGCIFYTCQVIPYFALGTFVPTVMSALKVQGNYWGGLLYDAFLVLGTVLGILVIDKLSRRSFLIGSFTITAIALAALSSSASWSSSSVVTVFAVFAFVLSAAANLEGVYLSELFPTELRASGIGLAVAASRVGAATATFLLPIVVSQLGARPALQSCAGVLAFGGLACLLWAPETRNAQIAGSGVLD
jgi:putative MFS transporter